MLVVGFVGCASSKPVQWQSSTKSAYPLDPATRKTSTCPVVDKVQHPGMYVNYSRPVKVNPYFSQHLMLFEQVVQQIAIQQFGTNAVTVRHFGAYNCRKIRGRNKLSEHAFGNAIDVSGFDIHDGDEVIKIRLKKDWWSDTPKALFLHTIANELATRPDIFRGMLGPGDAAHEDHFHFDMGKHRYARISVPR